MPPEPAAENNHDPTAQPDARDGPVTRPRADRGDLPRDDGKQNRSQQSFKGAVEQVHAAHQFIGNRFECNCASGHSGPRVTPSLQNKGPEKNCDSRIDRVHRRRQRVAAHREQQRAHQTDFSA